MTIGRIKVEALKLMFLNLRDVHEDELDELSGNVNYASYLANMPGAIHRACQLLVTRLLLPDKVHELSLSDGEERGVITAFPIASLIPDLYHVRRVVREGTYGYRGAIDFSLEADSLLLYRPDPRSTYRVIYAPSLPAVTSGTRNDEELPLPEPLAALIPFYIKGELFAVDEPDEAGEARNWFEAGVAEYAATPRADTQKRVRTVWAW